MDELDDGQYFSIVKTSYYSEFSCEYRVDGLDSTNITLKFGKWFKSSFATDRRNKIPRIIRGILEEFGESYSTYCESEPKSVINDFYEKNDLDRLMLQ